ncbi:hypothetical protein IJ096_02110, partial [Candidatus Saccharibacteria bacterium]|nr:hypothetical protein [Candidatus Saccharibacteria bacterium]
SSRLGNFLRAVDVIEMVGAELGGEGRNGDEGYVRGGENDGNDGGEGSGAKMKLTMAALKYAFLRYKMGGDIEFDVKSSVAVTGNSGVYLEYATVRAKRILEKIETLEGGMINGGGRELVAEEKALMKKICEYRGVLFEAVEEMAPHKVCAYLYELAQVFSRFYENVQVVGSEYAMERGRLVGVYLKILEHGLGMLGIKTVEEM